MKNRLLIVMISALFACSLCACTKPDKEEIIKPQNEISSEIIEEDGLRKEPILTNRNLNLTGESGPLHYTLESLQISNYTATNKEMAEILGIEQNASITAVQIKATVENKSDQTVSFDFGRAILTTNTKEEADPDSAFSEYIDSEFVGKVENSGSLVYLLKDSNAEELTSLTLQISAPSDEKLEPIGNDVNIDISLKK